MNDSGQGHMADETRTALPIDPDLEPDTPADATRATSAVRARGRLMPSLHADVIGVVFVGGCVGGALRYVATKTWPAGVGGFPWSTFSVNTAGAFVLALVVVIAAELAPSRYLRPLVGTGFCGALTTFSSIVVAADQLLAHGHLAIATAYVAASIVSGLAAGSFGLIVGRAVTVNRHRARQRRSDQ